METFVREAIARAAFERAEGEKEVGGGGGGWQGGFLEVSGFVWGWGLEGEGETLGKRKGMRAWLMCWWCRLRTWRNWHRSFCWTSE